MTADPETHDRSVAGLPARRSGKRTRRPNCRGELEHGIDDIDALLTHLGIPQAYIVGRDWASLLIHKFVRKYRKRVIKVVNMDPITPHFEPFYLGFPHMSKSWYSHFSS